MGSARIPKREIRKKKKCNIYITVVTKLLHMFEDYNRLTVLKVFFDDPLKDFRLREISRIARLAPLSVRLHLQRLSKESLVLKEKRGIQKHPIYRANRESEPFRLYKKINTIISIRESGLLDFLSDNCMPDAIALFGSSSRGEDTKESDIDLFLLCKERKIDLKKHESLLKRKISIFFSDDFGKISRELKNNILNGTILKGYLKVF